MNQATVYDGMEFLTSLYQQGLGYRTINTAYSALSAAINQEDKTTFRDHSLVTHFLKGIFELKPSLPRYMVIWDVGTVLQILQNLSPISSLTLKQLTEKLTTLLALVTTQRTQMLLKLDTNIMQELPGKVVFTIRETIKTTRPGRHLQPIEILALNDSTPVTHIKHYLIKTQVLHKNSSLPISYAKPHNAVTHSTIAFLTDCLVTYISNDLPALTFFELSWSSIVTSD